MRSSNQRGFSLIEVMVVGGLMAIVALGAASIQKMGVMGQKTLLAQDDSRTLTDDLITLLSNQSACTNTFATKNPKVSGGDIVTVAKDGTGAVKYEVGTVYGNRTIKLNDIRIGGAVLPTPEVDAKTKITKFTAGANDGMGNPTGTAFVQVDWLQNGTSGSQGPQHLVRYLMIDVTLDGTGKISNCTAQMGARTIASSGSGVGSYIPLWTNTTNLGNSILFQNASNNIGLGMAAPSYKLDIQGSGVRIYDPTTKAPQLTLDNATRIWQIYNNFSLGNAFDIYDGTAVAHRLVIDGSGNMGVGTVAPTQRLDVVGNIQASGNMMAAAYLYTSDARLKKNVQTINGHELARKLRGVHFEWIKNGEGEIGFIAQEVERVAPELVSTNAQGMKAVKYGNITALLVEAVKTQEAELAELRREVEEIKMSLAQKKPKK